MPALSEVLPGGDAGFPELAVAQAAATIARSNRRRGSKMPGVSTGRATGRGCVPPARAAPGR